MEKHTDYKLKSGNILRVFPDSDPESPDTWSNEDMFLVYDHRDFTVKRDGFHPKDIFEHINAKEPVKADYDDNGLYEMDYNDYAESINLEYNNYYIFTVYATIHSGVHLSLARGGQVWDVSSTGFVLVKKDHISDEINKSWKDIYHKGKSDEEVAETIAEGLIETWNQYLSGEVYGFQVLKIIKTYTITEEDLINLKIGHDKDYNKSFGKEAISGEATIYFSQFLEVAKEDIEEEEVDSCYNFYGDDIKTNGILDHIDEELIEE